MIRILHLLRSVSIMALSVLGANNALAHAFPEKNTPGAGAALTQPPAVVSIRFDSDIEPVFSTLIVKNAQGKQVSQGNGGVDPSNPSVLFARLTKIGTGSYHVYWSVIARDGHRTEGDYTFLVQ